MLGLGVLGEAGLLGERCGAARTARKRLDQVSRELRAQETIQPAPKPENAALIEADLAHTAQDAGGAGRRSCVRMGEKGGAIFLCCTAGAPAGGVFGTRGIC